MRPRTIGVAATLFLVSILTIVPSAVAQDVIGAAATSRGGAANGTLLIPIFLKDVTGTPAGRDKPACVAATPCSQISELEFKIDFDGTKIAGCLAAPNNCTFTEAGLLAGVKPGTPDSLGNVCDGTATTGCNFRAITLSNTSLTYTISTNPPLSGVMATTGDAVGDLVGYVSVVLGGSFSGTTTATLDASGACGGLGQVGCAAYLGGTDNTSGETVANAKLTLNNAIAAKALYDVDANSAVDAFTDGILMIRRMLGASGTSLTLNGAAVGTGAARSSATDLQHAIDALGKVRDVDGNGAVDAFTDGILMIRYMLGATGTSLTLNGAAVGTGCTRCTPASIQTYLAQMSQN